MRGTLVYMKKTMDPRPSVRMMDPPQACMQLRLQVEPNEVLVSDMYTLSVQCSQCKPD